MPGWSDRHSFLAVAALIAGLVVVTPALAGADEPSISYPVTELVSVATDGTQGDGPSTRGDISGNGRFVLFTSTATNLVPDDTNDVEDVFVRDLQEQTTTRVSVGTGGTEGNGRSRLGDISPDGRYATFQSAATNLVAADTNGVEDIFRHDRHTGHTELVTVATDGGPTDGSSSAGVSLSADGQKVGFMSNATNLVVGDTNAIRDGFVRDMTTATTVRVTEATDGTQANSAPWNGPIVSPDGTKASFSAFATNLVDDGGGGGAFVHDLASHATQRINLDHNGQPGQTNYVAGNFSADNRYVLFATSWPMTADDTNGRFDEFRRDLLTGTTLRVSVADGGAQSNGSLTGGNAEISSDGQTVTFQSAATNLVPGDTNGVSDAFVHDVATQSTVRIEPVDGPPDAGSAEPSISDDADAVAFSSAATNLVPGDTNGFSDVFVARRVEHGEPSVTATLSAEQTRVAVGQPVDHRLTITNTGDTTLTGITVDAPDLPDCEQPVGDLSPAATLTIDCTYIPTADDIGTVTTHATIHTDQTAPVTTNTVTVAVRPNRQPDLEIKKPGRAFIGDDTYNHDAAGQTATATRYPGRTATFYTRITNDGTAPARYQIIIPTPLPTGTRLYQGRTTTDLTTAITNHTYTTPRLTPGDTLTIRIETTAAPTGTATTTLRATTTGNHVPQHDTTTATLTTR